MKYYYDEEFGGNVCEPNCVADYLFYIWAIGCDYDGYETVEGLKSLVDELVDYANNARELLDKGEYYSEENPAPKPKTNFDRIKSMSVDEMAEYFGVNRRPHFPSSPCYVCDFDAGIFCEKDGCNDEYKKEVFKKWLEKEIEE